MLEQNIKLIYDGIDTNYWIQKTEMSKNSKFSFIFMGGLHINKGQEFFIRVLGLLPQEIKDNIIVDFYGSGSKTYKYKLKWLINKNSLDNCCNMYDYNPEIYKELSRYHIGVNCSKVEGFGRVTVEYMMSGLCPLVSKSGANVEIIEDGITGIMFDRENLSELKDKIIFIYNNKHIIKRLSENAKSKAFSSFSMVKHTKKICELYRNALY